jgi:cytochrome c oxidase subunit 3
MGSMFLVIKYVEWTAKISVGIYPGSPVLLQHSRGEIIFFGLYYVMTGLHGLMSLLGSL